MLVLGIDAAWTERNASGLALARRDGTDWRLIAAAPDVTTFTHGATASLDAGPILMAAQRLGGAPVDLVAVDMPLSRLPITARRAADRAVSAAYGSRYAATHSPSAERPGMVADRLREQMASLGYHLRTAADPAGRLVEVYPHPAIIEFMSLGKRLEYKAGKTRKYWPKLALPDRLTMLRRNWDDLLAVLEGLLPGTVKLVALPDHAARGSALKSVEDMLDAVVCAAVGVTILEGRAIAFGDDDAAIWIPRPVAAP